MQISEKTLEINFVRNFRYSSHLVWQGATLRQEARSGWDARTTGLLNGKSFILQFKRPYSVRQIPNGQRFTFKINNNRNEDQNRILTDLAQELGAMNVFYAFPCVENISQLTNPQLEHPREAILKRTALADLNQINLINLGGGKHKVEIELCNNRLPSLARVYSEPKQINLMTVYAYKEWGFNLTKLHELRNMRVEGVKSKKLKLKFFTQVPSDIQ